MVCCWTTQNRASSQGTIPSLHFFVRCLIRLYQHNTRTRVPANCPRTRAGRASQHKGCVVVLCPLQLDRLSKASCSSCTNRLLCARQLLAQQSLVIPYSFDLRASGRMAKLALLCVALLAASVQVCSLSAFTPLRHCSTGNSVTAGVMATEL
jgi:hypothetical protein